jgi:hypothetical protein
MSRSQHGANVERAFDAVLEQDQGSEVFVTVDDPGATLARSGSVEGMLDGVLFTAVLQPGTHGRVRVPVREAVCRRVRKHIGELVTVRMWPAG